MIILREQVVARALVRVVSCGRVTHRAGVVIDDLYFLLVGDIHFLCRRRRRRRCHQRRRLLGVIRGSQVLARHQPELVTSYNPSAN